jgi:hypothetical protein
MGAAANQRAETAIEKHRIAFFIAFLQWDMNYPILLSALIYDMAAGVSTVVYDFSRLIFSDSARRTAAKACLGGAFSVSCQLDTEEAAASGSRNPSRAAWGEPDEDLSERQIGPGA